MVDLESMCDLGQHKNRKSYYYCNSVHPSPEGMDMITSCLISEILEHSTKGKQTAVTHKVTTNLTECFEATGPISYAIDGKPFKLKLLTYENYQDLKISVTMSDAATGKEIAIPCDDVSGHYGYIPEVKDPVTITAVADKNDNFQWGASDERLRSQFGAGLNHNNTMLVSGTYTPTANSDGTYTGTCSAFSTAWMRPWCCLQR